MRIFATKNVSGRLCPTFAHKNTFSCWVRYECNSPWNKTLLTSQSAPEQIVQPRNTLRKTRFSSVSIEDARQTSQSQLNCTLNKPLRACMSQVFRTQLQLRQQPKTKTLNIVFFSILAGHHRVSTTSHRAISPCYTLACKSNRETWTSRSTATTAKLHSTGAQNTVPHLSFAAS